MSEAKKVKPFRISTGSTPSERYLHQLCRRSFLTLWSYANLYTDEGRKADKGTGRELCDLLVVFGDNVILFSDKHVEFDESVDLAVAWRRWFKRAVVRSASQLYGAESWMRRHPGRVFLDPSCRIRLPIPLPDPAKAKIHRVAVARGISQACRKAFGNSGTGSLMIDSTLEGSQAHLHSPFHVGHLDPQKGFVHVFDDFSLEAVLQELDTISDFIAYLEKREKLLTDDRPKVVATGEEQLLAIYLTRTDSSGRHAFVLPGDADWIAFDEGFWEDMIASPRYLAKKKADQISYSWDKLIEHLFFTGRGLVIENGDPIPLALKESALRLMAGEPRIRRRQLAEAILGIMHKAPPGRGMTRVMYSKDYPTVTYVFLVVPQLADEPAERYYDRRRLMLMSYCKVAKLICSETEYMVGIATDPVDASRRSEDLFVLDVKDWTPGMQEEAEWLQKTCHLLLPHRLERTEGRAKEYPDVSSA